MESYEAVDGALCGGFNIRKQKFNNKKEMIPIENEK